MSDLRREKKKKMYRVGDTAESFMTKVVAGYVFMLLAIYPLYYQDKYYNMGEAKWIFFKNVSLVFLVAAAAVFIWYLYCFINADRVKDLLQGAKSNLTVLDIFVFGYFIAALISTILSPAKDTVIYGYSGWYMGIIAQTGFVLIYFLVSRFWRWDDLALMVYLAVAFLVFFFGVIMRFRVDPMEMYVGLDEQYIQNFLSTMGQATWYSSYMTIIYPLGVIAFWFYDKPWQRITFGVFTAMSFMTAVTQNSDSAYFAIVGIFFLLFWISLESNKGFIRFLEVMMVALGSFKFIGILQKAMPERVVRLDVISIFMSQSLCTWILLAVCILLYVLCRFLDKKEKLNIVIFKPVRVIALIIIIAGIIGGVVFIYMNTMGLLPPDKATTNNYLLFDDYWGNSRGLSWKAAVGTFIQCDFIRKLFGAGPDGFASLVYIYYGEPLRERWGATTTLTCCHNEWLNAIINTGLIGGILYLGIFITAFKRFMKMGKEFPQVYAVAISIIAYMCHNFFCYQQIICTPVIFMLIGMADALIRHGYCLEE